MILLALGIIKGLTGSLEGIDRLKAKLDRLLVAALKLVPVPEPEPQAAQLSECALESLVNLSQDMEAARKMLQLRVIGRLMDYLREGSCPHHRLMASFVLVAV